MRNALLPALFVLATGFAAASGAESPPGSRPAGSETTAWHVFVANDGGLVKRNSPSDEKFSSGVGAAWTHRGSWARSLDAWMDERAAALPFVTPFKAERVGVGVFAAQRIFTPRDITVAAAQPEEHPWAGHLFGGGYLDRARGAAFERWRASLGVTGGPSGAEQSQSAIHRLLGAEDPAGWDHQIKSEPTLQLRYRRKWRWALWPAERSADAPPRWRVELLPGARVDLGTVRVAAGAGAVLRFGLNMPDGFGGRSLDDLPDASATWPGGFTLYGRAGVRGELVGHDLILEGGTLRDTEGAGVDPEPAVGTLLGGLTVGYAGEQWALRLSYTQRFRSRAFEAAESGHSWAATHLRLTVGF